MTPNPPLYHVQVLKEELERRKAKNSRYSLRAFARALGMDASALSRVLSGKQDLSLSVCLKILRAIDLPEENRMQFMSSVTQEKSNRVFRALHQAVVGVPTPEMVVTGPTPEPEEASQVSFTHSPDLMYVIDCNGRHLFANEAGAKVYGVSPAGLVGRTLKDLGVTHRFASEAQKADLTVFKTHQALRYEISLQIAETGDVWFERLAAPVLDSSGRVIAATINVRDITERKQAERRLWLLSEVGKALGASLDLEKTYESLSKILVEQFADGCALRMPPDADSAARVIVRHRDHTIQKRLSSSSNPIELLTELSHSVITAPIVLRGLRAEGPNTQGTLIVARNRTSDACSPAFNEHDLELLMDLANRLAQAVENARLYAESRVLSDELQLQTSLFQSVLRGDPVKATIQTVRDDGRRASIEVNASPLRDDEGMVFAGVVVFHDVSQKTEESVV